MGRHCTVCTHPALPSISAELKAGQTLRALAARYGLSDSALDRHARMHLRAGLGSRPEMAGGVAGTRTPTLAATASKKGSMLARVPLPVWTFFAGYALCWLRTAGGVFRYR